ncbi:sulfite exporter TauE/SafE family protein [Desulfosediminicola sp.]|uniref:sulfite exporter TauE/SafE family protein n=1 Tax=Desulfosediminicola sp. TaxID=2886825 RepID=UPI003AF1E2A5
MPEVLIFALAWFAAGVGNGLAGFGAAMIAMPLVAGSVDLAIAVPACTLTVLTLNVQVAWIFRRHIRWDYVKEIGVGLIPGALLSVVVLKYLPETWLKVALGSFVAGYALWNLFLAGEAGERVVKNSWGYLAGVLSAAMGLAFGVNGPPMVAYIAYSGCPAKAVRGTIGAAFIVSGVIIVGAQFMTGLIHSTVITNFFVATPAVLIGSKIGIWISGFLAEAQYRKVLFLALFLMGGNIAATAILQ